MKSVSEFLSKQEGGKLLAILPHADDASFVAGGLFQILEKYKIKSKLLYLTKADKTELNNSAELLGIDNVENLDFQNGDLANNKKMLTSAISKQIINFAPDIVLSFDPHGITGNSDHVVTSLVIFELIKRMKEQPSLIWRIADSSEKKHFDKGHNIHLSITPNLVHRLNLSQSIKKLKAIYAFKSKFKSLIFRMQVLEWYLFDHKELYYHVNPKNHKLEVIPTV